MNNSECFVIWVHRDAGSIFGAASHPVNENGSLATFREEQDARRGCDRLNANRGNPHVFYSVERWIPVASSVGPDDQEDILELTPELELSQIADLAA
jgi:hypothetical protein